MKTGAGTAGVDAIIADSSVLNKGRMRRYREPCRVPLRVAAWPRVKASEQDRAVSRIRRGEPEEGAMMKLRTTAVMLLALLLGACAWGGNRGVGNKSSLVEFLYPETNGYVVTPGIAQLELPLRIGVAFTPAQFPVNGGMTEAGKDALAQDVVREFASLEFVDSIQVIPSDYLRQRGSFANLDQLRSLFGIDVIVLLSYDQTAFTDESRAAITYWTIIGAYFIEGQKNDTATLLDAAVYDIRSRALLFRAPGNSLVKSRSTLVANAAQLRDDSVRGFAEAGTDLKQNLTTELETFKQRMKDEPARFAVTTRDGYTGSGSNEGIFLLLVVVAVCALRKITE